MRPLHITSKTFKLIFVNKESSNTAMSGYRPPYTLGEERKMLRYIVDNNGFYQLRGCAFWVSMEQDLNIKRTWQSLKEHFRKHTYNKINNPLYQLSEDEIGQIRDGYVNSSKDQPKNVARPKKIYTNTYHRLQIPNNVFIFSQLNFSK